jgi:hypothetical protein
MEEFRVGVERSSWCGTVMSMSGSSLLTYSQPRILFRLGPSGPGLVTPLLRTQRRQRLRTPALLKWVAKYLVRILLIRNPLQTYNGAIGIDEDGNPCGTVLEAAHFAGYKTGLVATSRITVSHPCLVSLPPLTTLQHATPASFASHIYDRDQEWIIAEQLVGNTPIGPVVDFQLGGGLGFFIPNATTGSTRPDDVNVLDYAREKRLQHHLGQGRLRCPRVWKWRKRHQALHRPFHKVAHELRGRRKGAL